VLRVWAICVIKSIVLEGATLCWKCGQFVSLKVSCWREQLCVESVGNLCH